MRAGGWPKGSLIIEMEMYLLVQHVCFLCVAFRFMRFEYGKSASKAVAHGDIMTRIVVDTLYSLCGSFWI